jgi:hypothetical protein
MPKRIAQVLRQRETGLPAALAGHDERGVLPVAIGAAQPDDVAAPQPSTGHQQDDRVIPRPPRTRRVTRVDDPCDVLARELLGQGGEAPQGKRGNGVIQAGPTTPARKEKAPEHPRGRDHLLGFALPLTMRPLQDKGASALGLQLRGMIAPSREHIPEHRSVMAPGLRRDTPMHRQPGRKLVQPGRACGRWCRERRRREKAWRAQEGQAVMRPHAAGGGMP